MKNLFRLLASSFAHAVSAYSPTNKGCQNTDSAPVCRTFFTPAGDRLQTLERFDAGITYGIIKITIKKPYLYLADAEAVLHSFLHSLQERFDIVHTTEAQYTTCTNKKHHATVQYGQDAAQVDWKVVGWTNGQRMTVRYIKNINALRVEWEEALFQKLEAA